MYMDENIYVAMAGDKRLYLNPAMANRHGLIAGATGTGKTVTMKVMAESFSDMGRGMSAALQSQGKTMRGCISASVASGWKASSDTPLTL